MKTKLLTLLLAVATTWAGQAEARWPSKKMIVGAVLGAVIYKAATANANGEPAYEANAPLKAGANDFGDCKQHFPNPTPPTIKRAGMREVCFDEFAILHSAQARSPVFVAERLTAAKVRSARNEKRSDQFYEEARLPVSSRAHLTDYARSGFDRGHMAPAGNMPNARAMAQSFSLANIVPQDAENNRGVWADIEKATRHFALRASGNVFVFTGPHYQGTPEHIGPSRIPVPTHLWKVVYDEAGQRAWAYWLPNTSTARIRRITYLDYLQLGGIDVLAGVKLQPERHASSRD